jgi:Ni/Co efflux regulator RcnB
VKRIVMAMAAVSCLAAPAAQAQTDPEIIERAVLAAPGNARANATVVKWAADGSRVVLRQGTNGVVCWDQSSWPGQRPFNVRCTSEANLPRVEQNREFFYKAGNAEGAEQLIQAAEKNGTRVAPEFGSAYYSLAGNDRASARSHVRISVPFATTETLKLPSKPAGASAWIMNGGTSAAHIMVPGH